jgi:VanZ family protein
MHFPRFDPVAIALLIYVGYVGVLTLAPFDFSVALLAHKRFVAGGGSVLDVVLNILGYVPFGWLFYRLTKPTAENLLAKWIFAIGTAAALSFALEFGQLFLIKRGAEYSDVLTNTSGGGVGFWLAHYIYQRPSFTHLARYRHLLAVMSLAGYLGGLVGLFLCAALPQRLAGWNPHYPLVIGDETTGNRPWLGKVFLVGLYDRALKAAEVLSQFQAGPSFEPAAHLPGRPTALYTFQEGGGIDVYDRSPVGPSLNLKIAKPQNVVWLPKEGLELRGPSRLRSTQPPDKLYEHITAGDTFSVAAWIKPKDALQRGPARIVSLSAGAGLRNFMLGQEASEIHFRVRTRLAGLSGSRGHLQTKGLGLQPQLTHLVAVYARGSKALYVNGVMFPEVATGDGLTVIAQMAGLDATSRWQRGLTVLLLLGPVGGLVWALRRR